MSKIFANNKYGSKKIRKNDDQLSPRDLDINNYSNSSLKLIFFFIFGLLF
jgi:hypothetical protein